MIERGEHRLLHLAGIGRAADQHDEPREIDSDHGLRARAMALGIGAEGRQVDDRHLRHEAFELRRLRPDQQVADEQRMPGEFGDDPDRQFLRGICAADEILHEKVALRGMRDEVGVKPLEDLRRHRLVGVPPDGVFGGVVADDELVLWRAARVLAGIGDKRAVAAELGLAAQDGFAIEIRSLEIVMNAAAGFQAGLAYPAGAVSQSPFLHRRSLRRHWRRLSRIASGRDLKEPHNRRNQKR
jgi:hypothetical protein